MPGYTKHLWLSPEGVDHQKVHGVSHNDHVSVGRAYLDSIGETSDIPSDQVYKTMWGRGFVHVVVDIDLGINQVTIELDNQGRALTRAQRDWVESEMIRWPDSQLIVDRQVVRDINDSVLSRRERDAMDCDTGKRMACHGFPFAAALFECFGAATDSKPVIGVVVARRNGGGIDIMGSAVGVNEVWYDGDGRVGSDADLVEKCCPFDGVHDGAELWVEESVESVEKRLKEQNVGGDWNNPGLREDFTSELSGGTDEDVYSWDAQMGNRDDLKPKALKIYLLSHRNQKPEWYIAGDGESIEDILSFTGARKAVEVQEDKAPQWVRDWLRDKQHHYDSMSDVFTGGRYEPPKPPPPIPLERKLKHVVTRLGDYAVLKLPADADWLQNDGFDNNHCLQDRRTAEHYAEQMNRGDQEQYSVIDLATGKSHLNFEVALTKPSYSGPVDAPTITQIRGNRNQCPPDDKYLPVLAKVFIEYGMPRGWRLWNPNNPNFDGKFDGKLVLTRMKQLGLIDAVEPQMESPDQGRLGLGEAQTEFNGVITEGDGHAGVDIPVMFRVQFYWRHQPYDICVEAARVDAKEWAAMRAIFGALLRSGVDSEDARRFAAAVRRKPDTKVTPWSHQPVPAHAWFIPYHRKPETVSGATGDRLTAAEVAAVG